MKSLIFLLLLTFSQDNFHSSHFYVGKITNLRSQIRQFLFSNNKELLIYIKAFGAVLCCLQKEELSKSFINDL